MPVMGQMPPSGVSMLSVSMPLMPKNATASSPGSELRGPLRPYAVPCAYMSLGYLSFIAS